MFPRIYYEVPQRIHRNRSLLPHLTMSHLMMSASAEYFHLFVSNGLSADKNKQGNKKYGSFRHPPAMFRTCFRSILTYADFRFYKFGTILVKKINLP